MRCMAFVSEPDNELGPYSHYRLVNMQPVGFVKWLKAD